jgi:hypothetical protein
MVTPGTRDEMVPRGRLILSALLLVYHPAVAAVRVMTDISALPVRGTPLALGIVARFIVAATSIAAGRALGRRLGADGLALAALTLSCALDMTVYFTSIFPNNRRPGDTPFYVAASLLYHTGWITYLWRTRPRESP